MNPRVLAALLSATMALFAHTGPAAAQSPVGTGFTFQGELSDNGTPVTGTYDLRFRLYDAATAGNQIGSVLCTDNLTITNGRFTVVLDFASAFNGEKRFLEIEVRQDTGLGCLDATGFTPLGTRQELTPTPYAAYSLNAGTATTASDALALGGQAPSFYLNAGNLTGTIANARTTGTTLNTAGTLVLRDASGNFSANTISASSFAGSGAALTGLNASNLSSGTVPAARLSLTGVDGSGLVNLNASNLASGTIPAARLSLTGVDGSGLVNLNASNLASGTVANARTTGTALSTASTLVLRDASGNFSAGTITASSFAGSGTALTGLNASNLASGTVPAARLSLAGVDGSGLLNLSGANLTNNSVSFNKLSADIQTVLGTQVPDWSTPPYQLASSTATGVGPFDLAISGRYAYVVNSDGDTLQTFDLINPLAPVSVASVAAGRQPSAIALSGGFAYVANRGAATLQVFSLSNPAAPASVGTVATASTPSTLIISGNLAYLSCTNFGSGALQIFSLSNPAAPTLLGSIVTGANPNSYGLAVFGSYAYVGRNDTNQILVINVSNPAAPVLAATVATSYSPGPIVTSGSFMYVGGGTGVQVYNLSTPASPSLVNTVSTGTGPAQLATSGNYVYGTNFSFGPGTFTVLNITAPASPTLTGTLSLGNGLRRIAISGYAYFVSANIGQLHVVSPAGSSLISAVARTDTANAFGNFTNSFAGSVGIGTTAPNAGTKLDVVTSPGFGIRHASGLIDLRTYIDGSAGWLGTFSNHPLAFYVNNGGQAMTIATTTNVGIGTTNPGTNKLQVVGTFTASAKNFTIDHPLDPANKTLVHSTVESDEYKNFYDGTVVTDSNGYATITLPDWFDALNENFRYQLTVIDESAPDFHFVRVSSKLGISGKNAFVIKSVPANLEVSWSVTGTRKDAFVKAHPLQVEQTKSGSERGQYLHPEEHGQPSSKSVNRATNPALQPTGTDAK